MLGVLHCILEYQNKQIFTVFSCHHFSLLQNKIREHAFFMCSDAAVEWKMLYYCCFIIVFQFGWACVQISHLALITQLTGGPVYRYPT